MTLRVDHTALKVNQACIVTLTLLAFAVDAAWLVAFVALVMAVGTIWPEAGLFKVLYARLLRPAGLLQPRVRADDPVPHLFAQGLGAAVLVLAVLALMLGAAGAGWALDLLVAALASVNLAFNFCAGCFMYYQLGRLGITHPRSLPRGGV